MGVTPWDDPYGGYDSYNRYESDAGHWEDDPTHPGQKRFIYGKSGAQKDIEESEALGASLYQRGAAQADYGDYQYGMGAAQKGMGRQDDALDLQREAATGGAPSHAEIAGRAAMDRSASNQMAAAGSVRGGPMQQAAAYRNAARVNSANEANMTQNITAERAAEMERARAGYMAGSQGYTQSGLAYGQSGLQKSGQELQNEQFQRGLNQQALQNQQAQAARTKEQDVAARQGKTSSDQAAAKQAEESRHNRSGEDIGKAQAITGIVPSDERTKNIYPSPEESQQSGTPGEISGHRSPLVRFMGLFGGKPKETPQPDGDEEFSDMGAKRPAKLSDAQAKGLSRRADSMLADTQAETARRANAPTAVDARTKGLSDRADSMLAETRAETARRDKMGPAVRDPQREVPAWLAEAREEHEAKSANRDSKLDEMLTARAGVSSRPDSSFLDRDMTERAERQKKIDRVNQVTRENNAHNEQRRYSPDSYANLYGGLNAPRGYARARMNQEGSMFSYGEPAEVKSRKQGERNDEVAMSDERAKNVYSDENTKDIKNEATGSPVRFRNGNIFDVYSKNEPEKTEESSRPGVSNSITESMGGRGLEMKDVTSHQDERLKAKEFSDDRAKQEAIYAAGRQAGRRELTADMQKTARLPKEAVDRNVREGDRASAAVQDVRDKAAVKDETPTQKALSGAQSKVRRAYFGAYEKGEPLGSPQGLEAGPAPGVRKMTTISTARGKDMDSVQKSAFDAEQAEKERIARNDMAYAQPKTLPSGERVLGLQPSDARTKEDAARRMEGTPYSYKEKFRPEEQEPGEVNVGPMAQNLEKNPITATVVKEDPKSGMKMVDMAKLVKVQSTEIAHLQEQIDEMRYGKSKKVANG